MRPAPVSINGRRPAYAPITSALSSGMSSAVLTTSSRNRVSPDVGCGTSGIGPGRLLVGQAQVDPPQLLGHREHEAVELTGDRNRQRRSGIAEGCGIENEVGAAAGPQRQRRVDLAGPHPGGVDDGARGMSKDSPVRWSVNRSDVPVTSDAAVYVRIRAPRCAAVRATAVTSRASSISCPS